MNRIFEFVFVISVKHPSWQCGIAGNIFTLLRFLNKQFWDLMTLTTFDYQLEVGEIVNFWYGAVQPSCSFRVSTTTMMV